MIKAVMSNRVTGERALFIGLSRKNVELLLEGRPIAFSGSEIGVPEMEQVIIAAGETEEEILRTMGMPALQPGEKFVREGERT
jgi:hypothetical protein